MGQVENKNTSAKTSLNAEAVHNENIANSQEKLKKANHTTIWLSNIVCAVLPLGAAHGLLKIYPKDLTIVTNCRKFISDFYSSGSFLWLSITLLVTALLELLLYGFKENLSERTKYYCKLFLIVATVFVIGCAIAFVFNIVKPMDSDTLKNLSNFVFIVFAIASRVISSKIVREG